MIWLTWRQLRPTLITAAVLLGAAAVYFVITGEHIRHTYSSDLSTCQSDCEHVLDNFAGSYQNLRALIQLVVQAMPALIGIFWGAPLIAVEFERGTHRMAWNQSVTPTRWLAFKLAGGALASAVAAGILSLLFTWWARPQDKIDASPFDWNVFGTRDITPVGYALFAFALGALLGLVTRKGVLTAMALTVAVYVGVQVVVATQIRPNIMPAHTTSVSVDAQLLSHPVETTITGSPSGPTVTFKLSAPAGSWKLSQTPVVDGSGAKLPMSAVQNCIEGPVQSQSDLANCLAPYNPHVGVRYEPASDFWPLQWYETGIYVALAGVLAGLCFWRIRRHRD